MTQKAAEIFEELTGLPIYSGWSSGIGEPTTGLLIKGKDDWARAVETVIYKGDLLTDSERREVARAISGITIDVFERAFGRLTTFIYY